MKQRYLFLTIGLSFLIQTNVLKASTVCVNADGTTATFIGIPTRVSFGAVCSVSPGTYLQNSLEVVDGTLIATDPDRTKTTIDAELKKSPSGIPLSVFSRVENATIKGFTIKQGSAGIRVGGSGTVILENLTIEDIDNPENASGFSGGIGGTGDIEIINVTIRNVTSAQNVGGRGISFIGNNLIVRDSIIENVTGNGIVIDPGATAVISSTLIQNNSRGIQTWGKTTLNDVDILNNINTASNSKGGGIFKSEISVDDFELNIFGGRIEGNSANRGGGIYLNGNVQLNSFATITNNTATENIASTSGGGIYCNLSLPLKLITADVTSNIPGDISSRCGAVEDPTEPTDETPQDDSNAGTQFSSTAIDPIDTYNGEFFTQKAIELNLGGPMPLYFQRYYAAFLRRSFIVGDLGNNWRHNFDARLYQLPSNQYKYVTHDGRVTEFTLNQGTGNWDQDTNLDTPYQITVVGGQDATIYDPTIDRIYTFDLTTSSTIIGKLVKIEDGKGNTHTVAYDLANAQIQSVSDGLGRTLNFTYNNDTIPKISVVDDGARSISFQYTDPNDTENLTVAIDTNLRPTLFVYEDTSATVDNFGLMRFMTRAEGNSPYVQTYFDNTDPLTNGRVATQTDADGNTFQLVYNNLDTTLTDPLSNTRVHTHTSTGEFASRQDENGLTFTMGSDSTGRRNSLTDRLGDTTTAIYNAANGKIESVTNADGTSYSFDYSARVSNGITFQDITGITHTDSTTETIVYDVFGNPVSYTNRLGDVSTATFNTFGQVLTSTNAEGGVTTNSYNADATLATSTDSAGNSITIGYDVFRRLNLLTFADANTRSFTRDDADNLLTSTNENGNTVTLTYNLNNNLQTVQDELLQISSLVYDGNDRLLSFTNSLGATHSQTFNAIGKLASVTNANNNVFSFGYNPLGRRTSSTDPLGNVWNSSYDLEGVLASITSPLSNTITYTSDSMGRITQIASPLGITFDITYDNEGRVISTTGGLGETTSYTHDANGLLSSIALPGNLVTTSYVRNKLGLITSIVDPGGNSWDRTYDNSGRLTSYSDPLGQTQTMSYDNRNRLSTTVYPNALGTQALGYDPAGNLTNNTYSDGTALTFNYDAKNRLFSANGLTLSYNAIDRLVSSNGIGIIRDPASRITQMTLAPAKVVTYTYDANDRVIQISDWLGGITTFSYDLAGNLTNINRPNGVNATKAYDNDSRLVSLTEGSISSIILTKNAIGDTTAAIRNVPLAASAANISSSASTVNAASQLDSSSYDALGRTLTDGTNTFAWNLNNRLTTLINSAGTTTYTYDATGKRLTKNNAGVTQSYVWNYAFNLPSISVERIDGNDSKHYVHMPNGSLLYSVDASTNASQFYHNDEIGNTIFVTADNGSVSASYAYSPFGILISETGSLDNPYTWQGQLGVMTEGNDLYYVRARYYNSTTGNFISRDPVKSIDPRSINPYQYALANPLRLVDPIGEKASKFEIAIKEAEDDVELTKNNLAEAEQFVAKSAKEDADDNISQLLQTGRIRTDDESDYNFSLNLLDIRKAQLETALQNLEASREANLLHLQEVLDEARETLDRTREDLNTGTRTRVQHNARKKRNAVAEELVKEALENVLDAGGVRIQSVIPQLNGFQKEKKLDL